MSAYKNISLQTIYTFLFLLGVFLIPFNNFTGLGLLREYSQESAIYPWLLGGVLMIIDWTKKRKIELPYTNTIIILCGVFIGWCLLTYIFNFTSIQGNYFKYRTGNSRFLSQLISLGLSSVFLVIYFWNVLKNLSTRVILLNIRKVIWWSFVAVFLFAIVEFSVTKFNSSLGRSIIDTLNHLPLINKHLYYKNRLSSLSFEVPALGNYLIFIAGWMFSYFFTEKNKVRGLVPTIMLLSLTFVSGARAATIVIFIQFCFFIYVLYTQQKNKQQLRNIGIALASILIIVITFKGKALIDNIGNKMNLFTVENNVSNQTRYGMQYASWQVFKENPITGVGLGQNTYHKRFKYPDWAIKNNKEFTSWYLNEDVPNFPPDFNIYVRLLAETGLIGFILFITIQLIALFQAFYYTKYLKNESFQLSFVILISLIGCFINWLQIDYFRQFSFWLSLALLITIAIQSKNTTLKLKKK